MLTPGQLAAARAAQESLMTSTGTVRADGAGWQWDGTSEQPVPGSTVYTGKLRIQATAQQTTRVDAGGQTVLVSDYVGAVPWNTTSLAEGHTLTVDESDDLQLVGARFTITDVQLNGLAITARRFRAELVKDGGQ